MRHPRGLNFANERRVVRLRDDEDMSWDDIAEEVQNEEGEPSTRDTVKRAYDRFKPKLGRSQYKFARCGRRKWLLTPDVQKFLLSTLLKVRRKTVCTSVTLQSLIAREMGVKLHDSTIRRFLKKSGYKWLPRAQKRLYSAKDMKIRLKFAMKVLRMSKQGLRRKLSLSMDGVILTMPPEDPTDRHNYCRQGETHMYRKPGERAVPELAGDMDYPSQIPPHRTLPMWGGVSAGGAAVVAFHKKRKLTASDWCGIVNKGGLTNAIKAVEPVDKRGPWEVLCDNEKFLHAGITKKAFVKAKVKPWFVPARSPDLNPVERFWAWLRRELRRFDLNDLENKRRLLTKDEYRKRVRDLLRTKKAQKAASNCTLGLRAVCKKVVAKKGAHSGK
jgi:transposase